MLQGIGTSDAVATYVARLDRLLSALPPGQPDDRGVDIFRYDAPARSLDPFVADVASKVGGFASVVVVPLAVLGPEPVGALSAALGGAGVRATFTGLAPPLSPDAAPTDAIAICCPLIDQHLEKAPDDFRVTAIVTAFNEVDVIRSTTTWLLDQGIDVVIVDNWSTDGTADAVADLVDGGRVSIRKFPIDGPTGLYEWERLLKFVASTAASLDADWVVHHDADQRHESPWLGLTYRDALYSVGNMGFNAVDHTVIDFRPIDNSFTSGTELSSHFSHFEFQQGASTTVHVQAWANDGPVDLASSGGHDVQFDGRRVFPFNFTLRHYQVRSQAHGEQKVFRDRRPRYVVEELDRGWHDHYFRMTRKHRFLRRPEELLEYVPGRFEETFLLQRLGQTGIFEVDPAPGRFRPLKNRAVAALRRAGFLSRLVRVRTRVRKLRR